MAGCSEALLRPVPRPFSPISRYIGYMLLVLWVEHDVGHVVVVHLHLRLQLRRAKGREDDLSRRGLQ